MNKTKTCTILLLTFLLSLLAEFSNAQNSRFDGVRLFQSYFQDARITNSPYVNGNFLFADFDFVDLISLDASGGYTITPKIEAEGSLGFINVNPSFAESESGVSDLLLTGRYMFDVDVVDLAAGAFFELPIGTDDVGAGDFDFGFYGAIRHGLSDKIMLTGNLQANIIKTGGNDREFSLAVGLGSIINVSERLNVIPELLLESESDFTALSGGVDYRIKDIGHIRGALIVGVDDGAPDIGITAGFLYPFN